jgi:hypothetical protein
VKRLDGLLERGLDDVVAAEGLTRRHWQVLDALAAGPAARADLAAALASFAGPEEVDAVLADPRLAGAGWTGTGRRRSPPRGTPRTAGSPRPSARSAAASPTG